MDRTPPSGSIGAIQVDLRLEGALDAEQRRRLREVAFRCPVHRALTQGVPVSHAPDAG